MGCVAAAVAGVDAARCRGSRRRPAPPPRRRGVAHHEHIHAHRLERPQGVESRSRPCLVDEVLTSKFSTSMPSRVRGQLEAAARARGGLEEQRAQRACPASAWRSAVPAVGVRQQSLGAAQQRPRVALARHAVQAEQVAQAAVGIEFCRIVSLMAKGSSGVEGTATILRRGEPAFDDDRPPPSRRAWRPRGLALAAPAARRRRSAARPRSELLRSSTMHHRQCHSAWRRSRAKPRARCRAGWSPPSSVIGSPTTRPAAATPCTRRSSAASRGRWRARRPPPTSRGAAG